MGGELYGAGEVFAADDDELVVVAGQDGLVVGELAVEAAAGEGSMTDAEEECVFVVGKFDGFGVGVGEEVLEFGEGLAGYEDFLFGADGGEVFAGFFDVCEAVAVSGDHGDGLGLEDEECTVEGVSGVLVGDGKYGFGDEVLQGSRRDGDGAGGGEVRNLGEVGAGHADHFCVGAAGADLDPVVVHELDADIAVREQFDVVVELAGGDGAGAWLFDARGAGGADALVEVSGGDGEVLAGSFDEEVGEDGNGGSAFDDALRGG